MSVCVGGAGGLLSDCQLLPSRATLFGDAREESKGGCVGTWPCITLQESPAASPNFSGPAWAWRKDSSRGPPCCTERCRVVVWLPPLGVLSALHVLCREACWKELSLQPVASGFWPSPNPKLSTLPRHSCSR